MPPYYQTSNPTKLCWLIQSKTHQCPDFSISTVILHLSPNFWLGLKHELNMEVWLTCHFLFLGEEPGIQTWWYPLNLCLRSPNFGTIEDIVAWLLSSVPTFRKPTGRWTFWFARNGEGMGHLETKRSIFRTMINTLLSWSKRWKERIQGRYWHHKMFEDLSHLWKKGLIFIFVSVVAPRQAPGGGTDQVLREFICITELSEIRNGLTIYYYCGNYLVCNRNELTKVWTVADG